MRMDGAAARVPASGGFAGSAGTAAAGGGAGDADAAAPDGGVEDADAAPGGFAGETPGGSPCLAFHTGRNEADGLITGVLAFMDRSVRG